MASHKKRRLFMMCSFLKKTSENPETKKDSEFSKAIVFSENRSSLCAPWPKEDADDYFILASCAFTSVVRSLLMVSLM